MTQIRRVEKQYASILELGKHGSAQQEYDLLHGNAADPSRTRTGGATNHHALIAGLCRTNGHGHTSRRHLTAKREEQR